jgi:phospholipid/cholesterol/gamma-HCH transport system substrate-binding protein
MDRTNYQTNVGLFALIALILLLYGWGWLKSFSLFSQPQRFTAQFSDVAGLSKNATVNIQGVRVGTVEYMEFVNDPKHPEHNAKINVHLKITDSTIQVPEGSHVSIQTLGLVGAKYIEIVLPRDAAGNVIKGRPLGPNDVLVPPAVEEPVRVELVMNRVASRIDDIVGSIDTQQASKAFNNLSQATAKLNKNMDKLKDVAESVQTASDDVATTANKFGKTADSASIATERAATFFKTGDETLHSIDETSDEFRGTARRVNKLLENPNLTGDLKEAIAEARKTAETIRGAMGDLEKTLQDKDLRAQVLDLLTHLEKSTENVKASLETVNKLAGDQGLRSDIKDIVHQAKEAISEADSLVHEPDFKSNICATLNKVRTAADNIDVAARQIQQVLDKRAPLLQMLFRRPGKKPPHTPDNPNCAPVLKAPKVLVPVPVQTPVTAPAPGSP